MAINQQNQIAEPGPTSGLSIFNIEKKVDSADKIATVAALPRDNFWFADEYNLQQEQIIQAAIDAINLNLTWSNKVDEWKVDSFYDKIHLLRAQIDSSEIFAAGDVHLCIKRYKHSRTERTANVNGNVADPIYKSSGFKNFASSINRPRAILLTSQSQIVDYKFENFFKLVGSGHDALGMRKQNRTKLSAYVYIQFHLEVSIEIGNDKKNYYSKPLKILKVKSYVDHQSKENKLTFKLN